MAAVDQYWLDRYIAEKGMYTCPNCDRELKEKLSQSAKNPGAKFVSCSADYGGCGFFGFLREAPNPKFLKGAKKPAEAPAAAPAPVSEEIPRKQEMLAAVSAALAEELGTDVSAIDRKLASTREDLEDLRKVKSGVLVIDEDDNIDQAPPWIRDVAQRAQEDPDAVVYNIQDAASKYSWLLIPISVPFLWILFPLRRRHMLPTAWR